LILLWVFEAANGLAFYSFSKGDKKNKQKTKIFIGATGHMSLGLMARFDHFGITINHVYRASVPLSA
jgi:hypothetical protein